jgi:hypothetical protein
MVNVQSFEISEMAKAVHSCPKKHWINRTLREELHLILRILKARRQKLRSPITHLVRSNPSATAWSDSCIYAAGGWCINLGFWWYIECPKEIQSHILLFISSNINGNLISINVLEYAGIIINYAACCYCLGLKPDPTDPYPTFRITYGRQ